MDAITRKPPASGCCSGCDPDAEAFDKTALTNACNLGSSDFDQRAAGIRDLARRALIESQRERLRLRLTYRLTAFAEIEELVAQEGRCCPFVAFELRLEGGNVVLTVTAPASAAVAADELFKHFIDARVAA